LKKKKKEKNISTNGMFLNIHYYYSSQHFLIWKEKNFEKTFQHFG
jgi:hypothetical protein